MPRLLDRSFLIHSPVSPNTERNVVSESENPTIAAPTPKEGAPLTNRDWWPNQVDVSKLHPHSPQA
ncbi:hypothetical protein GWI34_40935, partial [Actinomadura sp. DSM 109109]|nr:hypothetical protein [Actinomadura lepetitiana]